MDRIEFVDGTVWTEADIRARLIAGTDQQDSLRGYQTADTIDGLAGNDTLRGEAGADQLFGGTGEDSIYGGTEGDEIHGGDGDDTVLNGENGNDQIFGDAGADKLSGGADADMLDGGIGNDELSGGTGNDTYNFYRGAGADIIWESLEETGGGTDTVRLTGGILPGDVALHRDGNNLLIVLDQSPTQLEVGNFFFHESNPGSTFQIERIEFDGGLYWDLTAINQRIVSGTANSVAGGAGDNMFIVDNQADVVTESLNGGTDTIQSSVSYTLPGNVENLTLTGFANIDGTGNTLSNILLGNSGNNILDGGSWEDDQLIGGPGDDTFNVYNDTVVEVAGGGDDSVILKGSNWYTLPDNVENLRNESTDSTRATLYGNQLDNTIVARMTSNDIVYGLGGNDTLVGGTSNNLMYGGEGNDILSGLDGPDELYGGNGNDALDGGFGNDRLDGGAGDDVYTAVDATDTVIELPAGGVDTVFTGTTYSLAMLQDVENLTLTGVSAINGTGNAGNNQLTGNGAANTLAGGLGADTLAGGAGDDVLDGGDGDDTYIANRGDGFDFISDASGTDSIVFGTGTAFGDIRPLLAAGQLYLSNQSVGLGFEDAIVIGGWGATPVIETFVFEGEGLVSAAALLAPRWSTYFDADLGQWASVVVSSSGSIAVTTGGSVNGEISGTAQNDLIVASGYVIGGDGDDEVHGLNGDDDLDGGSGADLLSGSRGNDTLNGGTGADAMLGGDGDDICYVDDIGDVVTEMSGQGTDTVNSAISYTLTVNVERLTLTGIEVIDGTGNTLSNILTGNDAANVLSGDAGNDTLRGMAGDDTLNGGAGNDVIETDYGFDYAYGGVGNDTLTGGDNAPGTWTAEYLYGEDGDDLIQGGGKYAHLYGGAGNDELRGGSGYQQLYGEDGDDTLIAGSSTYILNGGAGADRMVGGVTSNTFMVDNVGDVVVEAANGGTDTVNSSIAYTLVDEVENLTLTGTAAIAGTGNAGNNALDGSVNTAANVLSGGLGDDTYKLGVGDVIVENADAGTDTVSAAFSYTLGENVENLTLTSNLNNSATGNSLNNRLLGNSYNNTLSGLVGNDYLNGGHGNDVLNGGAGADEMLGGYGNDTYYVDDASDLVTELSVQGTDTVNSAISYTLGANVERLTLTGAVAIDGTCNTLSNILTGNAAANVLNGDTGNDTLIGRLGDDTLSGGTGNDSLTGGQGSDIYSLGRGDGADTVSDYDAMDADPSTYSATTDIIQLAGDITHDQLWFTRSGNDLLMRVIGTTDQMTIQGWYTGSAYQVEEVHAGDGYQLMSEQVDQLVQAMAAFAPPSSGELSLSESYRNELEPVLAVNWQAA